MTGTVDPQRVGEWVAAYRRAWESNDPKGIGSLFGEGARYYTEPFAEPWEGRQAIVEQWLAHRDEPGQTAFRFEVLAVAGEWAFVRGWAEYVTPPPRRYSNLWVIRFDDQGRALEFTEWWMQEP